MEPDSQAVANHPQGLSTAEVLQQRARFGENRLPVSKGVSPWMIALSQFMNPLVYIILAAALVSLIFGEVSDFIIIMAVVIIDAVLGFVQEYQAHRTYTALRGLIRPTATVIRDGQRQEIEVHELVPGDLAILNAGERVPADGELVEAYKVSADEAILTGESEPVGKVAVGKVAAGGQNRVFMGTTLVAGRGMMRVESTGSQTELGQIAASLKETPEQETPLQVRLRAFGAALTKIVIGITLVIFLVGVLSGRNMIEMLRISTILAVAAVPGGLLIAVTVILMLGMRKILKRQGLVKRLLAAETLGSVTVICTDKTGTLTKGLMSVTRLDSEDPQRALDVMVLCNDLEGPVDIALWAYARRTLERDPEALAARAKRLEEEPFSSENKYMITACEVDGEGYNYLKGAPEVVLQLCDMAEDQRMAVLARVEQWASEGLRTLGLAYRQQRPLDERDGYTWAGLVAMEDPLRDDVRESIALAQRAGIQVKMITGDYRLTAERVAHSAGLQVADGQVLEGLELAEMSDEELDGRVSQVVVFARIRPSDKLRIIKALQARGEVVAMVGDGVNDAPALKRANIGVVVGSATDVAKETADLILLDNSFATIVAAIEEGRVIFDNIRKVVAYTLSNSFAEVLTIFGAMVMGWPAPLTVAQILWIHLICDGPSDIVLGYEPKEAGIMDEPPKSLAEPVLGRLGLTLIAVISSVSAALALLLFGHNWLTHGDMLNARSYAFGTFAVNSMVYIFAYRSMRRSFLKSGALHRNKQLLVAVGVGLFVAIGAVEIPALRRLLDLAHLTLPQWGLIFSVALGLLLIVEVAKALRRRQDIRSAPAFPPAAMAPALRPDFGGTASRAKSSPST